MSARLGRASRAPKTCMRLRSTNDSKIVDPSADAREGELHHEVPDIEWCGDSVLSPSKT